MLSGLFLRFIFSYAKIYSIKIPKSERRMTLSTLKAILFDLDGTLLPLDNDRFVEVYLGNLARHSAAWGYDPTTIVKTIWKATGAMVKNDGAQTNEQAFWAAFKALTPYMTSEEIDRTIPAFDAFYRDADGFHLAKAAARENPMIRAVLSAAHRKAEKVILATNPIFPDSAVESRLSWIGLTPADFDDITTYTTCSFSKPNPKYFASILEKHGLQPEECLMVGNNVGEDILPATSLGIPTLLVTDCLINEKELPLDGICTCTFAELENIIENL